MQVGNQFPDKILTVGGRTSRTYYIYNPLLVQLGITEIKQSEGGIRTLCQSLGVVGLA